VVSRRVSVVHAGSYDAAGLWGVLEGGVWREGVLPRVLQQQTLPVAKTAVGGAADGCGQRWLVLDGAVADGALDGGWLLPLLGVPRRVAPGGAESDGPFPPGVELPTGEALRIDADVRVLIEAASLAHAPPHAHALLGVVYVPAAARAWRAQVQSWVDRVHGEVHAAGTEAALLELLAPLSHHLPAALGALAGAQAAPDGGGARGIDAAACVATTLWLLEVQLTSLNALLQPEATRDIEREITLARMLLYSLSWGVAARCPPGAAREAVCAALIDSGLGADAELPEACGLLDFAVDSRAEALAAASREGDAAPLLLWAAEPETKARKDGHTAMAGTTSPLQLELSPRCQPELFVPDGPCRALLHAMTLLAPRPLLLSGPAGGGKSMVAAAHLDTRHVAGGELAVGVLRFGCGAAATAPQLLGALLSRMPRSPAAGLRGSAAGALPLPLWLDDVAEGGGGGDAAPLALLRQLLSGDGVFGSGSARRPLWTALAPAELAPLVEWRPAGGGEGAEGAEGTEGAEGVAAGRQLCARLRRQLVELSVEPLDRERVANIGWRLAEHALAPLGSAALQLAPILARESLIWLEEMRALVAEADAPLGQLLFHPRQLQRIWAGVRLVSRASRAAPPPPPPPPPVEVGVAGEEAGSGEPSDTLQPPSDDELEVEEEVPVSLVDTAAEAEAAALLLEPTRETDDVLRLWLHEGAACLLDGILAPPLRQQCAALLLRPLLQADGPLQRDWASEALLEVEADGLPPLAFHREPDAPMTSLSGHGSAALAPRYRPLPVGTIARAEVLEKLQLDLERFNREPREASRPLHPQVLAASLPAVLRVWRALWLPGGHALLVGPRGARKASLARLAAFAAGLRVVELPSWADEQHESAWLRQALCGVLRAACAEPRKTALVVRSAQLGCAAQLGMFGALLGGDDAGGWLDEAEQIALLKAAENARVLPAPVLGRSAAALAREVRRLLREQLSVLAVAPASGAALSALAEQHAFVAEAFVHVAVPHWPEPALVGVARAVLSGATADEDADRALVGEAEGGALASALARMHLHACDAPDARGPAWRPPPGNEGFCLLVTRLAAALQSRVAAAERELEQLRRAATSMRAAHSTLEGRSVEDGSSAEARAEAEAEAEALQVELARVLEALGAAQEAQPSLLGRSMLAAAGAEYAGSLLPLERAALLFAARGADDGNVLQMPASPGRCASLLLTELAEGTPRPSGAFALWPEGSQAEATLHGGALGCGRAPLLVDPHGHAEAWLRRAHGGNLVVASCDETCAEPLRKARARGTPVLLVHVQGELPECVRLELTEWQLARHEPPDLEVRRAFQKYDDNNSGQLDAKELRGALQDLGLRHNTKEASRILQEYDGGGDGLLSLAEFIKLVRTLADGLPDAIPGDVQRAFNRIDENKSGQLDHKELRAALHDLGLRNNTGEAVRLLQEYDKSGDGLLSLHEFGKLVRQLVDGATDGAESGGASPTPGMKPGWTLYMSTRLIPPHVAADSMAQLTPVDCLLDTAGVGEALAEETLCAEAEGVLARWAEVSHTWHAEQQLVEAADAAVVRCAAAATGPLQADEVAQAAAAQAEARRARAALASRSLELAPLTASLTARRDGLKPVAARAALLFEHLQRAAAPLPRCDDFRALRAALRAALRGALAAPAPAEGADGGAEPPARDGAWVARCLSAELIRHAQRRMPAAAALQMQLEIARALAAQRGLAPPAAAPGAAGGDDSIAELAGLAVALDEPWLDASQDAFREYSRGSTKSVGSSRASPTSRRSTLRRQATIRPVAAAEEVQQALAAVLPEAEGWGAAGRAPILLLSRDGVAEEEPMHVLADAQQPAVRVRSLWLAGGSEAKADELLLAAAKLGDWLLLQQCSLCPAWLARLPRRLQQLETSGALHVRFQLWLACDEAHAASTAANDADYSDDAVPSHLLVRCVHLRVAGPEPPRPQLPAEIEAEVRKDHRAGAML